jgi:hypothetical protein
VATFLDYPGIAVGIGSLLSILRGRHGRGVSDQYGHLVDRGLQQEVTTLE